MERLFLGWDRPALPMVADWLLQQSPGDTADLANLVVVVPGRRAQRRLLELLAVACDADDQPLLPPTIVTVGRLPEQLYEPKRPFASELTQSLAWTRALETIAPAVLRRAAPHHPTDRDRLRELADLFRSQHKQLAADRLSFADVAEHYEQQQADEEARRWRALERIQRRYLDILDELLLWDIQTARLVAIQHKECRTDRRIILAGAVDLNRAMRAMLQQVPDRVTSLVLAPAPLSNRFDEFGCILAQAWSSAVLNLPVEQTRLAKNPVDQARQAVEIIQSYQGRYRADQIVIGAPDEQIVPQLRRELDVHGAVTRWGPGEPVSETAPFRLLAAIAAYLQQQNYATLAELARHPDIDRYLRDSGAPADWLQSLDRYFNEHLPSAMESTWLGELQVSKSAQRAYDILLDLLAPLHGERQVLPNWREPVLQVLTSVFGNQEIEETKPASRATLAGLEAMEQAFTEAEEAPKSLAPVADAAEAILWALQHVGGGAVAPLADDSAIEILGWLELTMDDAPALIVTSLNEGFVPQTANGDLFLPNSLRNRLGMEDNDRRYARDAYAISMLLHSRDEFTMIVARQDGEKNPLAVSRLLLAVAPQELPLRVQHFFEEAADESADLVAEGAEVVSQRLAVPRPQPLARPMNRLSVTRFRDYLACPYRFYLRHVLRLEAVDDDAQEMSAAVFGVMLHEVLRAFGAGPCKDSDQEDVIRAALHRHLDEFQAAQFGATPLPAVRIQVEQMRRRLDGFAAKQAEWIGQGWRIHTVEPDLTGEQAVRFPVDGQDFFLGGKIDRIDRHEDGRWAVFDYKSFDQPATPEKKHQRQGEWIDLQLPLYRVLAAGLGVAGDVLLGYILLPKDADAGGFAPAAWTEDDLREAEETARDVIRKIRAEAFWPPADPPKYADELAAVCQDNVWNRQLEGANP